MTTHKVRVSNKPHKVLEVDDGTLQDLEFQGLLVNEAGERVDRDGNKVEKDAPRGARPTRVERTGPVAAEPQDNDEKQGA